MALLQWAVPVRKAEEEQKSRLGIVGVLLPRHCLSHREQRASHRLKNPLWETPGRSALCLPGVARVQSERHAREFPGRF